MDGNTTSTQRNYLIKPHPSVYSSLLVIGQRGTVQKLDKMEKTPTASKEIMSFFAHLEKLYGPKSLKKLKSEDGIIILCVEAYTTLSIVKRILFRILIGNLDGRFTPIAKIRLTQKLIP